MDKTMQENENENIDSTNDEVLEANETSDVVQEDNGTNQEDATESQEQDDLAERLRIAEERAERYKRERDRLKTKTNAPKEEVASDLVERTFLMAAGYKDKDEQQELLTLAKSKGLSLDKAIEDPMINRYMDAVRAEKKQSQAASRPTGVNAAGTTRNAQWYADKGIIPEDPKLVPEVWAILAARENKKF